MSDVKEYINSFIQEVNEELQWNYSKSARTLKKRIKDIVFQVNFYSSKYNSSSSVELKCECQVWCRAYNKKLWADSGIGHFDFLREHTYWWDVTEAVAREEVKAQLLQEIKVKLLPIVTLMEEDFVKGVKALLEVLPIGTWDNSIRLADEYVGREIAVSMAEQLVKDLSDGMKARLRNYLEGTERLVNEYNLRYILDKGLI